MKLYRIIKQNKIFLISLLVFYICLATEGLAQVPNNQKGYRTESVETTTTIYDTVQKTQRYPLSRFGISLGPQFFETNGKEKYVTGFGAEIFLCQTAGKNFFFSVNTGFNIRSEDLLVEGNYIQEGYVRVPYEQTAITYPVLVGFHWFLTHYGIRPNIGIEFGGMFKSVKNSRNMSAYNIDNYSDIFLMLGLNIGMSVPVSKDFAVEVNFRSRTDNLFGIDIGASYFLNW